MKINVTDKLFVEKMQLAYPDRYSGEELSELFKFIKKVEEVTEEEWDLDPSVISKYYDDLNGVLDWSELE
jgi:hypothetical protein